MPLEHFARARAWAIVLAAPLALGACHDDASGGRNGLPAFIYVAEDGALPQLFRFRNDSVVQLTTGTQDDQPSVAGNHVAFSSRRDGNAEIYVADLDLASPQRVTEHDATDDQPSLGPAGDSIVFVSSRNGIARLWMVGVPAPGSGAVPTPVALETGTTTEVIEQSPAWSPAGGEIAFSSLRTGTSQVFIVPSRGGAAEQVSHELNGAFSPVWSADGRAIYYATPVAGRAAIRKLTLATGSAAPFAADADGIGDLSCGATICVAITGPGSPDGKIVAIPTLSPEHAFTITARTQNARRLALLPSADARR